MDAPIGFTLNGKPQAIVTDPDRSLLEVLREDLHLTGTKFGCGEGACRACTVLINGEPTPSCLAPVSAVNGQTVLTIEGLERNGHLHPVQEAFLTEGAFQCGYCTAGMIMGVIGVTRRNPHATEHDIFAELDHHICRCGSYVKYRAAVRRVVDLTQIEKRRA
ncbi:MAG: (2Fe-2S)-binding protein [Silvibacterium sp.]|nr:(2Fe-2S)-binding protein [Silvibacterium sp.]